MLLRNPASLFVGIVAIVGCSQGTEELPSAPAQCDIVECFRAVNCVEECGGPVLSSGCCPCPEGTFDDISCRDGSQSAE